MKYLKRFNESNIDLSDILPVVKDMLLELSDLDYTTNCVIRRGDGKEYIRIGISKPAISHDRYNIKASYTWSDIKDVMEPVIEFLKEEGFLYRKDQGTLSYDGIPIISTSGSARLDNIKSRCEMWFEI